MNINKIKHLFSFLLVFVLINSSGQLQAGEYITEKSSFVETTNGIDHNVLLNESTPVPSPLITDCKTVSFSGYAKNQNDKSGLISSVNFSSCTNSPYFSTGKVPANTKPKRFLLICILRI